MCLCPRFNTPGPEHWRGAEIRARAQRIWAERELRAARRRVSPDERKQHVASNMYRMEVVSKDVLTGQWILGRETADSLTDPSTSYVSEKMLDPSNMMPDEERDLKEGLPTAVNRHDSDSLPATKQQSDEQSHHHRTGEETTTPEFTVCSEPHHLDQCQCAKENTGVDNNNDDDDVCHICLDSFRVGDIVMWSRQKHGHCSHVFHEECLMPWLLEKRENECPSCRACFINDRVTNNNVRDTEGRVADFSINNDDDVSQIMKTSESMDHSDGGPSSLKDDRDIEEGFTFVISKGLIGRVPIHDSVWLTPPPKVQACCTNGKSIENRNLAQTCIAENVRRMRSRRRPASEDLGGDTVADSPSSSWDEDDTAADEVSHGSPRYDILGMLSTSPSPDAPCGNDSNNGTSTSQMVSQQNDHDMVSPDNVDVNERDR